MASLVAYASLNSLLLRRCFMQPPPLPSASHRTPPARASTARSSTYDPAGAITAKRHIVLLSGGVESSTLLRQRATRNSSHIIALFVDYGQRAAEHERRASLAQCVRSGVTDVVQLDLRSVGAAFAERKKKERRFVPLPHRNLVLLALATSLADLDGADVVSVAVSSDDQGWYPSAGAGFLERFRSVASELAPQLQVDAPLIELGKAEIVSMGIGLGVDFETTWSCMVGRGMVHCGRCGQCRARKEAFRTAGVEEGEGFYAR